MMKAEGFTVGKSLVEDNMLDTARGIKKRVEEKENQLLLPTNHQVVDSYEPITRQQGCSLRQFQLSLLTSV